MLFLIFIFFKWDFQRTFEIVFHQDNFAKTPVVDFFLYLIFLFITLSIKSTLSKPGSSKMVGFDNLSADCHQITKRTVLVQEKRQRVCKVLTLSNLTIEEFHIQIKNVFLVLGFSLKLIKS